MKIKTNNLPVVTIHKDLSEANELVYKKLGLTIANHLNEAESDEYGAATFTLGKLSIKYRIAKITATKTGQFVTLWKRKPNGPIQPHDISDPVDLFIISTRHEKNFGQFIFPKSVLLDKGILSSNSKGGKRGIRVYPPWNKTTSKQASKTQLWQVAYFLKIDNRDGTDLNQAIKLLTGSADLFAELRSGFR